MGARVLGNVSFLTDYGLDDEFVGVCKAVMLGIEPTLSIIDVTHGIAPHDVRAGALALARSAQYLPEGVLLAVVDPGVGSGRRAVAVEVGRGFLVGPDNGLLAPAVAMLGGARSAVELTNADFQVPSPGSTFAGRDIFAPAAAHLASGTEIERLGSRIDPLSLVPGLLPLSSVDDGRLSCEVLWEDRFGNLQLNVDPGELDQLGMPLGATVAAMVGSSRWVVRRVASYVEGGQREPILVVDSYGLASLAVASGSASELLAAHVGTAVVLSPIEEGTT